MSVWKYLFDSEWLQRSDIDRLEERSNGISDQLRRSRGKTRDLATWTAELQEEIARLTLVNETLLRLLVEKGVVEQGEFRALLVAVDEEDGVRDGKLTRGAALRGRISCAWCKTQNDRGAKFCASCHKPLPRIR